MTRDGEKIAIILVLFCFVLFCWLCTRRVSSAQQHSNCHSPIARKHQNSTELKVHNCNAFHHLGVGRRRHELDEHARLRSKGCVVAPMTLQASTDSGTNTHTHKHTVVVQSERDNVGRSESRLGATRAFAKCLRVARTRPIDSSSGAQRATCQPLPTSSSNGHTYAK